MQQPKKQRKNWFFVLQTPTQTFNHTAKIPPRRDNNINTPSGLCDPLKGEKIEKPQQSNILCIWYWLSAIQPWSGLIRFPVHKEGHSRKGQGNQKCEDAHTTDEHSYLDMCALRNIYEKLQSMKYYNTI